MRDANSTPGSTKNATRSPASPPVDTSRPGLSSQFEKLTDAIANRPGSSRCQCGRPIPRTIGARAIWTPKAIRAVRRSEMNGAPRTRTIETRSNESGPDRPASPVYRPAGAVIVDGVIADSTPEGNSGVGDGGRGPTAGSTTGCTIRPARRVIRRSARAISNGSCVARTTPTPAARAATTTPATADHVNRSWPTVGSSRTRTEGPWAMAPASASRRCSPPERWCGSAPDRAERPSTSSRPSTRVCAASSSRPSSRLVESTSSRTVRATTASSAC